MDLRERLEHNPFWVLGVALTSERGEIERAGQRLLAELAIGRASARTYETPLGSVERTADAVRSALAELRDPDKRLVHEAWATLAGPSSAEPEPALDWARACRLLGLRSVAPATVQAVK